MRPSLRYSRRRRRRSTCVALALYLFATWLVPLLHNLDHQPDHTHGPLGTTPLPLGFTESYHHHEHEDDDHPGEHDRDHDDDHDPSQPSDPHHGAGSLEHFAEVWVPATPELVAAAVLAPVADAVDAPEAVFPKRLHLTSARSRAPPTAS